MVVNLPNYSDPKTKKDLDKGLAFALLGLIAVNRRAGRRKKGKWGYGCRGSCPIYGAFFQDDLQPGFDREDPSSQGQCQEGPVR
jgi:hypothetical protein